MAGLMASNWTRKGVGRGVRTRGGFGRGAGTERRYIRNDCNVFSRLPDPTQSDTEGETSDTEDDIINDDGFTTVDRRGAKSKRRRISSGGRSGDLQGTRGAEIILGHEFLEDKDFDSLSTDSKLSLILSKLSLNQGKVERIENMLFSVVKRQKRISDIETVVRSHDSRVRLLEYKSLDIEARSRRNNILIYGFSERRNENCADRIVDFLNTDLGLDSADRAWIERAHRLGRYDRTKSARPIIVAFSSYRYVEAVMANVNKLRDSVYSVNRDFPSEISRARKLLWPKLKQVRQQYPLAKASLGYPAKIIMNGKVIEDLFPEWDTILRGSRIDAAHPSQQNLKSGRPNTNQSGNFDYVQDQLSQSLLPQQPRTSPGMPNSPGIGGSGMNRPTTVDFDIHDPVDNSQANRSGVNAGSPMEQGDGEFARPMPPVSSDSQGRKSRSRTRDSKGANRNSSPRSVSARSKSTKRASQSASRSASRARSDAQSVSRSASRARSDAELTEQNGTSVSDAGNAQQKQPGDNNVE